MSPDRKRLSRGGRVWIAAGAAVFVHAVVLSVMGLVRPSLDSPGVDNRPDVELQLLQRPAAAGSEPITAGARQKRRDALAASSLARLVAPAPDEARPQPGPAAPPTDSGLAKGGPADCIPEDIPLLSPEEKTRCRNQIEVARARRATTSDDAERAARIAAMRALPKVDGIAPGKRAYYDAVTSAERAVREDFTMKGLPRRNGGVGDIHTNVDMNVSARCSLKFGPNKGRPADPRLSVNLGPFNCPLTPPTGFLTEEARVAPP